jgi:hypothetical protein
MLADHRMPEKMPGGQSAAWARQSSWPGHLAIGGCGLAPVYPMLQSVMSLKKWRYRWRGRAGLGFRFSCRFTAHIFPVDNKDHVAIRVRKPGLNAKK